jgi:phage terminase large subunit GpA-like protein
MNQIIPYGIYTDTWSEAERLVFRRRERVPIDVWTEQNRVVETGPRKGKWRNRTTPYLVGPMRALSDPSVRKVICMFAPQTGKTQIAFNFLGHAADLDPAPAMYVMPDEKVARRILRRRLLPMFRQTPVVANLLSEDARDITALAVYFRNGMSLIMAWATSAAELASEPIRYLILDEVDKYPEFSGREVDPIALAEMRTNAFPHTKKILEISTPTSDEGYINQAMEKEADEVRRYHVPCPKCGAYQVMVFERIVSTDSKEKDPRAIVRKRLARYKCVNCGHLWDDAARDRAVRNGQWRANKPVDNPVVIGFHLPAWNSPFVSLSSSLAAFRRGLDQPGKLYIFRTQHEAVPWQENYIPKKEEEILKNRCDLSAGVVPEKAIALTCGIDMQKNGFFFVVKAREVLNQS